MRQLSAPGALALATSQAPGAPPVVFLPMRSIPDHLGELDPTQPVVCICHHGARSAQVVAFLERSGFESAYNLAGGIDAWSVEVDAAVPRY